MERIHNMLSQAEPDFVLVDQAVHQLKGSSASFGAAGITRLCMQLRDACQHHDRDSALQLIRAVAEARTVLESRLVAFMDLDLRKKELLAA
jgi:histidine-containing phosphotransfer protein